MLHRSIACLLVATLHSATVLAQTGSPGSATLHAAGQQDPAPVPAPLIDAHQHLWSSTAAARASDRARPRVTLPPALAAFLAARIRAERDTQALAALYTADAWLLQSFTPAYIRTRDSITTWWVGSTDSPYDLVPVGYGITGSAAHLAMYLVDQKTKKLDAHVVQSLAKGADGRWRITTETLTMGGLRTVAPISADYLVGLLDSARIGRAVVHSLAYLQARSRAESPDEQSRVRAENDWTAAQVKRFPDRLLAFCSVNPLRHYAVAEVERCAALGSFRGLKLHIGNSGVDLTSAADNARLRELFRLANQRGLAIAIHLATYGTPYGRHAAQRFVEEVLSGAPDVPVQIAHLASPGHLDAASDSALAVFVEGIAAGDPRMKNVWFDLTTVARPGMSAEAATLTATRIRQLGPGRMLYGSDTPDREHLAPREGWAELRKLPLTEAEFRIIAGNVPPYAR